MLCKKQSALQFKYADRDLYFLFGRLGKNWIYCPESHSYNFLIFQYFLITNPGRNRRTTTYKLAYRILSFELSKCQRKCKSKHFSKLSRLLRFLDFVLKELLRTFPSFCFCSHILLDLGLKYKIPLNSFTNLRMSILLIYNTLYVCSVTI